MRCGDLSPLGYTNNFGEAGGSGTKVESCPDPLVLDALSAGGGADGDSPPDIQTAGDEVGGGGGHPRQAGELQSPHRDEELPLLHISGRPQHCN